MKKFTLLLLPLFVASTNVFAMPSYGNMPQNITVCVAVEGSSEADGFYAGFISSDVFDHHRYTSIVANGVSCTSHLYKHGPKNIHLLLRGAYPHQQRFINVMPDGTCDFMSATGEKTYKSNPLRSENPSETWQFTLRQTSPIPGYRYSYTMHCDQTQF